MDILNNITNNKYRFCYQEIIQGILKEKEYEI